VPGGRRAIASLKVGDKVTAYDPTTGKTSTQTVQHVCVNHDHDLLDVTLHEDGQDGHATKASSSDKTQEVATKAHGSHAPPSDETLHTTSNHPWLTTDRGWVKAGDLHTGEHVVELGGRTARITALAVRPGAATYYNLTVSQLHTYAVGASRAVVHNTEGCLSPADQVRAKVAAMKVAMTKDELGRTTYGVAHVTTADGADEIWVSQAGVRGWVRPGLRGDAINVRAPSDLDLPHINDAELHLWRTAEEQGATINALGATRDVCLWCQARLPDSIPIVTPLKS
jgi:pretoxin HINT domain-containing protein